MRTTKPTADVHLISMDFAKLPCVELVLMVGVEGRG